MSIFARVFGRGTAGQPSRIEPSVMATDQSSGTQAPSGWLQDLGWGSQSRVKTLPRVTAVIAQKHATVTACCSIISGDLSKLPIKLYRRDGEGNEERIRNHPVIYLLNTESSLGVPAKVARFALNYAFCLRGRAFAYAPRDGHGEITLIDVVKQDGCQVLRLGRERYYDFEDGAGVRRRAPGRAMVHLRYLADDSWSGRSPIEVAAESLGLVLAGQEAAARSASGITTRAVVTLNEEFTDDEARRRRGRMIKEQLLSDSDSGVAIMSEGEAIKSLELSAADQELLASRKFDVGQVRALYRVPAFKLQDAEHGVKANGEQQATDYVSDCLTHWGGPIEETLGIGVLTERERRDGLFLRHDYGALLRPLIKDQYDALYKAVGGPFMVPDEARKIIGRKPIKGGDQLNPAPNMTRNGDKPEKE